MLNQEALRQGQRITGEDRERLQRQWLAWYDQGDSIRTIAEREGRSYGNVHRLIGEALAASGRHFRERGGATRGKATRGALTPAQQREYAERLAARPKRR